MTAKHSLGEGRESQDFWSQQMLTAKDLEELLKIDTKTIYSYVRRGLIPYVRIQSNVRFPIGAILHWIEQQTFTPRRTKSAAREKTNQLS